MGETEQITFNDETMAEGQTLVDEIRDRCRAVLERDPRWKDWKEQQAVLHHFVLSLNVAGTIVLNAVHALAACGAADIEEVNYYLDDWCSHQTASAKRACAADFAIALFLRVKQHDGECGPPPGEATGG